MGQTICNVAHVLRRFVPEEWGGIESAAFHLCKELKQRQIGSAIHCTDMMSEPGSEDYHGVNIVRYRYTFPWFGLSESSKDSMKRKGGSPLSFSLLYGLLAQPNLDLIHSHTENRLGGIARTVARWRGIPYVVTVHAGSATLPSHQSLSMMRPFENHLEWGKIFGFLLGSRQTLEDADAIICVSQEERDALQKLYPEKLIRYIPNGVDTGRFVQADPSLFRETYKLGEHPLVLCVSRFDDQKNQRLLIEAFSEFRRSEPNAKLALIGSVSVDEYYQHVLEDIKTQGLEESVLVIPGLAQDDPLLSSAYKAANMFVLPSQVEQQGIVVLEAWAAGVPVVASAVGGIPHFTTDQQNVLHFDNGNARMLCEKMLDVHRNSALKAALVNNGLCEVERKYSWSAITDELLDIYQVVKHGIPRLEERRIGCS